MKLKNKILTLIAGTLTTFALTSCTDFLDRDPLGQLTEDDAPNAHIGGKMYNVYYLMRSYNITAGIPAFMIHMVRSEDSEKGSDAGDGADQAAMWDDFQYTASNGTLSAYWGQNYKIIYQCNEILDDLENSENKDDPENVRTKGEALFFRAYCYFNLVRAWGEVPLVTFKVEEASDANVPKTTADKIYEQIDKDLTEAEKCLPLTWTSEYTGRITWGAARSLHARTYMMRNDWDNMYDASTEVVKSGIYNLNTPVDKVFTVEGENCGESVFELQCESTDALKNSDVIGRQFCQVQGVRGAGDTRRAEESSRHADRRGYGHQRRTMPRGARRGRAVHRHAGVLPRRGDLVPRARCVRGARNLQHDGYHAGGQRRLRRGEVLPRGNVRRHQIPQVGGVGVSRPEIHAFRRH